MRRAWAATISQLIGAVVFCSCGGGGGGAATVGLVAVSVPSAVPLASSGIVTATGPLTMLDGGPVIGSTIAAGSAAAIFTIDSGTSPSGMAAGGSLVRYPIVVSDVRAASVVVTARLRGVQPNARPSRDLDIRIPDAPLAQHVARALRDLQRRSPEMWRHAEPARTARTRGFLVGDTKTFALQGGTINGSGGAAVPIFMPATLVAQSAHANVWLDDAVYRNPALLAREYPSGTTDFGAVTASFDSTFRIETQAFGPAYTTGIVNFAACDAAGTTLAVAPPRPDTTGASDPHINIVITDRLAGSGEGGYFYGLDLLDQSEANCVSGSQKPAVNGLPMLVIASDAYSASSGDAAHTYPANNERYWLTGDMPQTIAHEFQHYLHFVNKYLQQHVDDPSDPNAGTLDDAYIDEGCSVLAQDLVADTPVQRESPAFVRAFLLEPSDFSLTSFSGYQPNALDSTPAGAPYGFYRNTAGNYGYAYLFVRYLYDRFGPAALKAIYAEKNYGQTMWPNTHVASVAAGGEPFPQLFREFTAAIAVHSGGSAPQVTTNPAFRFDSSVILRGATQTYSRRLPPYDVRNIVQPGPLNPQTFSAGIPTGFTTLSAGQTQTFTLLDGGAVFISPSLVTSQGATLRATLPVTGGGSLGQGPMPMPSPAYY